MKKLKISQKIIACVMMIVLCSNPAIAYADNPSAGNWVQNGSAFSWISQDGSILTNAVTPDGYFVNASGLWQTETREFLGEGFILPDKFLGSKNVADMGLWLSDINKLNKQIQQLFQGARIFHVYQNSITYSKVADKKETQLLALYLDNESNGWKIRVSCSLDCSKTDKVYATSIDFVVLQFFVSFFSHTPDYVADAVYRSWEGDNLWKLSSQEMTAVGDSMIKYSVEDGAAIYQFVGREQ